MHIRTFHEESCADLYTRSLIVIILSSRLSAFCNVDPRIDCGGGGIIDGVGCSTAAAAAAATARSAPSLMLLPPALALVFRERLESRLVDLTGVLLVVLFGLVSGVSFCFTGLAALGPCRPMYEYAVPPGMLARCAIGVASTALLRHTGHWSQDLHFVSSWVGLHCGWRTCTHSVPALALAVLCVCVGVLACVW